MQDAVGFVPVSVKRAMALLWISVALLGAFVTAQAAGFFLHTANSAQDISANILTAGILAFLALKMRMRRNWARLAFLFLYAAGMLLVVTSFVVTPRMFFLMPTVSAVAAIVQLMIQSAAVVLLFVPSTRRWFKTALD
jgi:hypothetical protein